MKSGIVPLRSLLSSASDVNEVNLLKPGNREPSNRLLLKYLKRTKGQTIAIQRRREREHTHNADNDAKLPNADGSDPLTLVRIKFKTDNRVNAPISFEIEPVTVLFSRLL